MGSIVSSCRAKGIPIEEQPVKEIQKQTAPNQKKPNYQCKHSISYSHHLDDSPNSQELEYKRYKRASQKYKNYRKQDLAIYDQSSDCSSNFQTIQTRSKSLSNIALVKNFTIKIELNGRLQYIFGHGSFLTWMQESWLLF